MPSSIAVVGLTVGGFDVQRKDLGIFLEITIGLDELPEVRGSDEVIPFVPGRLMRPRLADTRKLVLEGIIAGALPAPRSSFRTYIDQVKRALDPTASSPVLIVAKLEDGTTRTIAAVPRNIAYGQGSGGEYRSVSVELEALDPYWHGAFVAPKVAAIGDSILQIGGGGSMHPWQQGATFFALACWRSLSRIRYWGAWGNSGDTTAAMLARIGTITALDPKPDACVIEGGTNDTNGQTTSSIANITAICDALVAAGIRPILTTIVPSSSAPDAANNMVINAWMRTFVAARGYVLVDFWAGLADGAGAWAVAGDTSDGTHPSIAGATKMADLLVAALVPTGWAEPDLLVTAVPRDANGVWADSLDTAVGNASAPGGGTNVVTLDAADKVEGTGSAKFTLTAIPAGAQGRSWHAPGAKDLSGYPASMPFRLWVKVSTLANLGEIRLNLGNVATGWTAWWRLALPTVAGIWTEILSTTGIGAPIATTGSVDLSTTDKFQFECWAAGGAYTGVISFDNLRLGSPKEVPSTLDIHNRAGVFDFPGGQGQDADWSRYGVIPTYALVADPAISGKWERLTATGTGQMAIYRSVSSGWSVGDRILFTGRVRYVAAAASALSLGVLFTGAAGTETCYPFYSAPAQFSTPVLFAMERTIPAGTTALRIDLMANGVAGDVVDYAQIGLWNLTRGAALTLDPTIDSRRTVIVPASTVESISLDTGGTAEVDRVVVTFVGPSVGSPGLEIVLPSGEVVGFSAALVLGAGATLVVDNRERVARIGFVSKRSSLVLRADNRNGEYVRFPAGPTVGRLLGQATTVWIDYTPTYL